MSMFECLFLMCVCVMYGILFSFGFNGQVHNFVPANLVTKFALFFPRHNSLQPVTPTHANLGQRKQL